MDSKKKIIRIMIVVLVVGVGVVAFYVGSLFMGGSDKNKTSTEQQSATNETNTGIQPISPGSVDNSVRLMGENTPKDVLVSEYVNRKVLDFEVDQINGTLYFVDADNYKIYKKGQKQSHETKA